MSVSFVQWGSHSVFDTEPTTNPATRYATFESNPASGNLLVLAIALMAAAGDNPIFTTPPGWSHLATWDSMTGVGELGWYYRFATSGEGKTVEIVSSGEDNESQVMFISEWGGVDSGDPFHDGATFRGSQVTDLVASYTTATVTGTREMLYLAWGQWERAEFTDGLATIGNGWNKRLSGHFNNDRFVQADYMATVITPRAANWSWPTGTTARINAAIIGFSGALPGASKTRTDQTIFRGINRGIDRGMF